MNTEKKISDVWLWGSIADVLEEIRHAGTVFIITGIARLPPHPVLDFVIGPPNLCGQVVGLVDAEYGWPVDVHVENVSDVRDLFPEGRRQLFIYVGSEFVAVAIHTEDYDRIKENR